MKQCWNWPGRSDLMDHILWVWAAYSCSEKLSTSGPRARRTQQVQHVHGRCEIWHPTCPLLHTTLQVPCYEGDSLVGWSFNMCRFKIFKQSLPPVQHGLLSTMEVKRVAHVNRVVDQSKYKLVIFMMVSNKSSSEFLVFNKINECFSKVDSICCHFVSTKFLSYEKIHVQHVHGHFH